MKFKLALPVIFLCALSLVGCEKIGDHRKNKTGSKDLAKTNQLSSPLLNTQTTESVKPEHKIKVVFLGNTDDEDYDGALVLKDFVESRTNGKIRVEIFPGGQLCGNTMECIQAVQAGVVEVFMTPLGGFGSFFPEIQVLDLPYIFDNDREVETVYTGPFIQELRKAIADKTGIRLMVMTNTGGWRNIANSKKQIRSPKDMAGLKLRTINSEVQIELVKLLGANPTPIAWPELYTSLATGVVDGSKNGITDIVGMKFHEHIKHITLDGHAYMSAMWMMNQNVFEGFSPEYKKILTDGFENLRGVTTAIPKRKQISAFDEFKKSGGTVYVPTKNEKKLFVKAAEPIYTWYEKKYGPKWLKKLRSAVNTARQKVDVSYDFDTEKDKKSL